jgi:hypothetical protein
VDFWTEASTKHAPTSIIEKISKFPFVEREPGEKSVEITLSTLPPIRFCFTIWLNLIMILEINLKNKFAAVKQVFAKSEWILNPIFAMKPHQQRSNPCTVLHCQKDL